MGIIDPEMQCIALLISFIVRGLFAGDETWKMVCRSVMGSVTLRLGFRDGHVWQGGHRFIFTDAPVHCTCFSLPSVHIADLEFRDGV